MDGFRSACRRLWAEQVDPARVSWHAADDAEATCSSPADATVPAAPLPEAAPVHVPAAFMPLCESVVLHRVRAASACSIACSGGCRRSPACATTRSIPTGSRPGRWRRRSAATCGDDRLRPLSRPRRGRRRCAVARRPVRAGAPHRRGDAPFFARRFTATRWAILTPSAACTGTESGPAFGQRRAPRPGAAGRCRRGALAHLLPRHLIRPGSGWRR